MEVDASNLLAMIYVPQTNRSILARAQNLLTRSHEMQRTNGIFVTKHCPYWL